MLWPERPQRKSDRKSCSTAWNRERITKEQREKYNVSYTQVYQWVQKYLESGEAGLSDRRGKRKSDDELDELERLRRENQRLKKKLEESERLNLLLKKVKEFEGR